MRSLAILLLLVWISASASAQPALTVPSMSGANPIIEGYVHFSDIHGTFARIGQWLQPSGVPFNPIPMKMIIGSTFGDSNLGMVPPTKPLTYIWLKTNPEMYIVVLDKVSDTFGLDASARAVKRKAVTFDAENISIIAPEPAFAQINPIVKDIKAIHQSNQAAITCYFDKGSLSGVTQAMDFLANPSALTGGSPNSPGAPGMPQTQADPDTLNLIGQLCLEIDSLQLQIGFQEDALTATSNITPKAGTPLAAFLNQPAPTDNPLGRYLATAADSRSAFSFDGRLLSAFLQQEFATVSKKQGADVARISKVSDYFSNIAFFTGQGAYWTSPDGNYVAIVKPIDPSKAIDQIRLALMKYPAMVAAKAAAAGAKNGPVLPSVPSTRTSSASATPLIDISIATEDYPPVVPSTVPGMTTTNGAKFLIQPFIDKNKPGADPVAYAAFAGEMLIVSKKREDLIATLDRILRLQDLLPPPQAQSDFVQGCNVYSDLFLAKNTIPITLMARIKDGLGQVAIKVPAKAIPSVPLPPIPAAPSVPSTPSAP